MNKLENTVKSVKTFVCKHTPEILTGIGIGGMVTSTVLAVKATPKAMELIRKEETSKRDKLTPKEIVLATWKEYLPSVSLGVGGAICIISGCKISTKRGAALATAYAVSERTLRTYKDKVIETIGERKEKDIREKVSQDNINNNPPQNGSIVITQRGNTLIKDEYSGRYFRSDLDSIKKASNELNREMLTDDYISLNQWYSAIGLDGIKSGDDIGWNISSGLIELDFGTCLVGDEPCITMEYSRVPAPSYNKMF